MENKLDVSRETSIKHDGECALKYHTHPGALGIPHAIP